MCGVFGYIGQQAVNITHLQRVADLAARRGPYAYGYVWWQGEQLGGFHYGRGSLCDHLDELQQVSGATTIIGQARLATSGAHTTPKNNQPLIGQRCAIAHNGNVYNAEDLNLALHLAPESACDSETLLLMIEQADDVDLVTAVQSALQMIDDRSPLALLVAQPGRIIAARRGYPVYRTPGHPLFTWSMSDGQYFSSRAGSSEFVLMADSAMLDVTINQMEMLSL